MYHISFSPTNTYETAILVNSTALNEKAILDNYINQLTIDTSTFLAVSLEVGSNNRTPVTAIREYLDNLLPQLDNLGITTLYVCNSDYFKVITKSKNAEKNHGYVLDCAIEGYEYIKVILGVNYQAMYYNPLIKEKLLFSLKTLESYLTNNITKLGSDVIHTAAYPNTVNEVSDILDTLHKHPMLTVDIETFSLIFTEAYIGTIAFAWDQHNGAAFAVDYSVGTDGVTAVKLNTEIRKLLKKFFETYKGFLIFHKQTFDCKILIFELWMERKHFNTSGLIKGLNILTNQTHDTKLIAYLALNSTARNSLSLKDLAHEYTGNYAVDNISDITKIPLPELLKYNLIDALGTWFVFNKFHPIMCGDQQEYIYKTIFKPSVKVVLQMELSGFPMDMDNIKKANIELEGIYNTAVDKIQKSPIIKTFTRRLQEVACHKKNKVLKVKKVTLDDFKHVSYNPGSSTQTRELLYEYLKLPVLATTKKKQASTKADTLKKLLTHTTDPLQKELIDLLLVRADVAIILNTFLKAFLNKTILKENGVYYLHGNFNLGGTVSGRMSSSDVNLQNLPSSGTMYAKIVKKCFKAPKGFIFVGADFSSLEDKISALTTKDPNKLKVYEEGYDGHCLRAYSYFKEQMPDIIDTVASINSIDSKHPQLRQDSKMPTFALTYQGTWITLMNNLNLPEDVAKKIEANYHKLYAVSDKWVEDKLSQAGIDGYVTAAFGLRVRTPLLAQTYLNKKSTPNAAYAESRTAGNALGQSYGMLTNRAGIEFQERTLASKYALAINPIAHIHDALYFIIEDNIDCLEWFNNNLIDCMKWQKLKDIEHPTVKLGGETMVYYPDWSSSIKLPNNASQEEIRAIIKAKSH